MSIYVLLRSIGASYCEQRWICMVMKVQTAVTLVFIFIRIQLRYIDRPNFVSENLPSLTVDDKT